MPALPTGTVTFLFTDIEGSTTRWEHHRAAMAPALDRHNALLAAAVDTHGGFVFKTVGDAFCAAFASPTDAVATAIDAQRGLAAEDWARFGPEFPYVRVRMGLHTSAAEHKDGDYLGPPLNRTARLMSAAHGGQILLSLATQQLVRDHLPEGAKLLDLGEHRLKDLKHTEHLFRLVAPGFPDIATPPDTAEALPAGARAHVDVDALPAECPYRGLFAFREADAPFFFGREAFSERLTAAVATKRMVGVIGPSGSGKSSVVFAGLVPELRNGDGGGASQSTVLEMRPGAQPFHALAAQLVPLLEGDLTETARLVEVSRMADALREETVTVPQVLRRMAELNGALGRIILIADQFEELYTLCPAPDLRHRFLDTLFEALVSSGSDEPLLTLVLTLRADFMGHALGYRPFADALQDHNVVLGPMTKDELTRAIVQPAEKQGRTFESGLPERLLADLGDHPGNLPLLEFALTQLWAHQESGWLTHEAYDAIGHVEGALARYADEVYDHLPPADQARAERVFLQLVRPGEGTEDTRRVATHAELGEPDWNLVRRLADARLVVTDRDATDVQTAEVVHEALIRNWGRLRGWMDANRAFRTWQERLRHALRQWEATGRDDGALLRGAPLAEAEGWLKERGATLGDAERAFVAAGLELRDRRAREQEEQVQRELTAAQALAASAVKLRRRALLLAAAMVASIVFGIAALLSRQQAAHDERFAQARELAAAALVSLDSDPERSTLLALQAVSVTQPVDGMVLPEVATVLHRSVAAMHLSHAFGETLGSHGASYSPDGTRIATAGVDKTIKVWDAASGLLIQTLSGHTDEVYNAVFSPDGMRIAAASADKTIKVWDVASGRLLQTLSDRADSVSVVLFSPDGTRIATAADKTVKVWDTANGRLLQTIAEQTDAFYGLAFSPDWARLATAGPDETAKVWDTASGQLLQTLAGHTDAVIRAVFSPDGKRVATASADNTAKVWDATSGRLLQTLAGHTDNVVRLAFSPDGTRLATASNDNTAKVWDAASGRELHTLARHDGAVWRVVFSPDGRLLATGSTDKKVMVWDVASGGHLQTLTGHSGAINSIVFSPDSSHVVSTALEDTTARLWDLTPDHEALAPDGKFSSDVAFSPDGRWFATAPDMTAVLHDTMTGQEVRRFVGHTALVLDVDFSPDGRRLATAGSDDKTARIWDTITGQSLVTLCCHDAYVQQVTFSPNGEHVATASHDKTAKVWDASSGRLVQTLAGHTDKVHAVVYSQDGKYLATVSEDKTARLWDASSGNPVRTFTGHTGAIYSAWFSPDGRRLATASSDDTVGIWDVATGKRVRSIDGLMGAVSYVAVTTQPVG